MHYQQDYFKSKMHALDLDNSLENPAKPIKRMEKSKYEHHFVISSADRSRQHF